MRFGAVGCLLAPPEAGGGGAADGGGKAHGRQAGGGHVREAKGEQNKTQIKNNKKKFHLPTVY